MKKTRLPRAEYPRPQFERESYISLNGKWSFCVDNEISGTQKDFMNSKGFQGEINVPFCPESRLSGIENTDFMHCVWYQREICVPKEWCGKRIILHFGGVDYESEVYIDGISVGIHYGGMTSFSYDISRFAGDGKTHSLVLRAFDDPRKIPGTQPGGKQSIGFKSAGCHYTRTTGIWQSVWMEAVDRFALESCRIAPDLDNSSFSFIPEFYDNGKGLSFTAEIYASGKCVGKAEAGAANCGGISVKLSSARAWSPADPFLYDIVLTVKDGAGRVLDSVKSYAGLRKVHIDGNQIYLNNKPIYLRLVLDQGFYPEGIWTAPSDDDLKRDIELSMKAGFNGARLHQKVFEERFHYWADKLGYLTWGESASWGMDPCEIGAARNFMPEWAEILKRDRNHPSIIAWTPLNETWHNRDIAANKRIHLDCYKLCKLMDPTRPVNDASGYSHNVTDIWTVHDYTQDPKAFLEKLSLKDGKVFRNIPSHEPEYTGQPYIVDEFGGIKWIPPEKQAFADNSWGYGDGPKSLEEFYSRLEGQVDALLSLEHVSGYCYTQLTDVEQEQNGIYNYDRTEKFDMSVIHRIFSKEK